MARRRFSCIIAVLMFPIHLASIEFPMFAFHSHYWNRNVWSRPNPGRCSRARSLQSVSNFKSASRRPSSASSAPGRAGRGARTARVVDVEWALGARRASAFATLQRRASRRDERAPRTRGLARIVVVARAASEPFRPRDRARDEDTKALDVPLI